MSDHPDTTTPGAGGGAVPRRHKPRTRAARRLANPAEKAAETHARSDLAGRRAQITHRLWAGIADRPVPNARPATMLRDLFGARGRPTDTAAAAAALGVSRRTVQRWISHGPPKRPTPGMQRLREQWAASPAARKRQVSPARKKRMLAPQGLSVAMTGKFIISGDPGPTRTVRAGDFHQTERQALLDALTTGDDDAAYAAFIAGVHRGFGGSVELDIDLDSVTFTW